MRKRGFFFSSDALIALVVIFLTLMIFSGFVYHSKEKTKAPEDLIGVLSNLKIGEIDNDYVKSLIAKGSITNTNKTILEQIGEFYVENETLAKNLSKNLLNEIDPDENIGIWYENELLASVNDTPIQDAENIQTEEQLISGLKKGESVTGFSSRAYLENNLQTRYFYFGGYVGDGNISVNVNYSGDIETIKLEITSNEDFDAYINGNFSGHYQNSSSELKPAVYDLSAYNNSFKSGNNIIKLVGDNQNLHIAGGYLKLTFENSSAVNKNKKYDFPGIEGLINIYDSFYIPKKLDSMDVYLHMNTSYDVFLNIGNKTIYNDNTSGQEKVIEINNSEISSELDYGSLVNKTIPLRLGMMNGSYVKNITIDADVISVTDLSGSMCGTCNESGSDCCTSWWGGDRCNNNQPDCEDCGGVCEDMIYDAKDANKDFIEDVLNRSGNRVGLVGYESNVDEVDCHNLSTDNSSLKNKVDEWEAVGGTCICCGINKAAEYIDRDSSDRKYKSIVVMSDGQATETCSEQGTGSATDDAIQAACDAYENHDIVVHTVGFGSNADETTLQDMADCGDGNYYFSEIDNLTKIYHEIAQEILNASYEEQTLEATGNNSVKLYSDSHIEFDYEEPEIPYGLVLTDEKKFYDAYEGNFSLPENSSIVEATAVSYSGPRWTSIVNVNEENIYNLSKYGSEFIDLGDPYSIKIPNDYIEKNNTVRLTTALHPGNQSEGSEENKIIYKVIKKFVSYSPITSSSGGCIWNIDFDDGYNKTIKVPQDYEGDNECYYQEEDIDYSEKDATQVAVYELLREADFDNDGIVDVSFSKDNLVISSSQITGIPYSWSTKVQIRRWD